MSIKPVVMQTLSTIFPLFLNRAGCFWKSLLMSKPIQPLAAAELTAKMFMDRSRGEEGL